jgi:hypothetical protein
METKTIKLERRVKYFRCFKSGFITQKLIQICTLIANLWFLQFDDD